MIVAIISLSVNIYDFANRHISVWLRATNLQGLTIFVGVQMSRKRLDIFESLLTEFAFKLLAWAAAITALLSLPGRSPLTFGLWWTICEHGFAPVVFREGLDESLITVDTRHRLAKGFVWHKVRSGHHLWSLISRADLAFSLLSWGRLGLILADHVLLVFNGFLEFFSHQLAAVKFSLSCSCLILELLQSLKFEFDVI